jgi:hypothetical protein
MEWSAHCIQLGTRSARITFHQEEQDEDIRVRCDPGTSGIDICADHIGGIFQTILQFRIRRTNPSCHHANEDGNDRQCLRSIGSGAARSHAHEHWPWVICIRLCDKGIPETILKASSNSAVPCHRGQRFEKNAIPWTIPKGPYLRRASRLLEWLAHKSPSVRRAANGWLRAQRARESEKRAPVAAIHQRPCREDPVTG